MISNNVAVNENGKLTFVGRDTTELAKKYGTPLYLLNENDIVAKCREYRDAVKKYFSEKK